jgi:ketosteroid isomerase-like protein
MPESSPREIFGRLIGGISEGRWEDLADLYAEDAVVEQPFAGAPFARIEGRETIRAHFTGASGADLRLVARDIVVHETTDPEVVIAEFVYDITSGAGTGSGANVQVLRVRDGLIQATRDYHDHQALATARA